MLRYYFIFKGWIEAHNSLALPPVLLGGGGWGGGGDSYAASVKYPELVSGFIEANRNLKSIFRDWRCKKTAQKIIFLWQCPFKEVCTGNYEMQNTTVEFEYLTPLNSQFWQNATPYNVKWKGNKHIGREWFFLIRILLPLKHPVRTGSITLPERAGGEAGLQVEGVVQGDGVGRQPAVFRCHF